MAAKTLGWWDASDPTGRSVREFRIARAGVERPVTGALWSPADAGDHAPLVLFGHGASGDRYQAPICHLAHRFVDEAGCHALAIDGPVHGMRQVGPGGRAAFGDEIKRPGFMDDMVADWHAALDAARGQVSVGDIGYFGLSMGSIFGIPLVATLPETTAAVLGLLGTTKAGGPFAERILSDAARIRCPVLFLMQLEDELFPRDGYLAVFDALASTDKRIHANPGLHPEVPADEIAASFAFIERLLGGSR
ncbi:MAG: dienelactone hydrolase family protein [Gammaproteobacteria bacterium]|nr:dienelactone hydrolase family protein [Gammaproteobacteria bacterium]